MTSRQRVRHITPSMIARMLEVDYETVLAWIRRKSLPALNIGTGDGRPHWRILRADAATFFRARGMTEQRIRDLLG